MEMVFKKIIVKAVVDATIKDTCANESAEALNELSEKYGIEVDLSDE